MPFHRQGVKTHRDWLVVGFDKDEIKAKMESLRTSSEDEVISALGLTERYKASVAHSKRLVVTLPRIDASRIIEYSYRPFDDRYLYNDGLVLDRPRFDLQRQIGSVLLVTRRNSRQWPGLWSFAHVTKKLPDIDMRGGNYVFPLTVNGKPNFSRDFLKWATRQFGRSLSSDDLIGYIYAILYCDKYRREYACELRVDFPRIPLTTDKALFTQISEIGKKMIALHLLSDPEIETLRASFPETGSDIVEKLTYEHVNSCVVINDTQWFSNIPVEVWNYEVGGYQVCERWLRQRFGRKLNSDDQITYMKMIGAIKRTIQLQQELDRLYSQVESTSFEMSARNQRMQQNTL
jgi:predicted helicase